MRQPEVTKAKILKLSGQLFNTQGYKATSIGDITKATRLTKGAIYRHFKNKNHLEKEALRFLSDTMFSHIRASIKAQPSAPLKLKMAFRYFETYITNPPIPGGCPLLNVAPEVDDANPLLRKQAMAVLELLRTSLLQLVDNGIRYGQLRPRVDKKAFASVSIALLEGAIMMSKLKGDNKDIRTALKHLEKMIDEMTV
ncbi:MAG: TetR/AcrR family transcriptional regulator [Cyclobacteriaceae bacterium]|jgi:AcrR family transcriptional regulator|nr:TetR/AcrR family transcriptional regulator [Cyclobacteriaceae bacterium]